MLKLETIEFLKSVPPFNFLSEEELSDIAGDVSFEYYPKGLKILAQNGPPADQLRLIKKGGVRVFMISEEGEEINIDYRGEGEQFGIVSMVSGDRSRANIVAEEDTICFLIPRERVLGILGNNPKVNEYFVKSFFLNFIDKTYEETRKHRLLVGESERVLFTTPVRDILKREPVNASETISIREAAGVMAKERISSLVLVNSSDVPVGIITDRDLREKVVAKGRDPEEQVKLIMSTSLIKVDAGEFCFEALLKMIRYNIHHLLVIDRGNLKGVVTNHDFMVLQGSSPMVFVKAVEKAQDIESLKDAREKLVKVVEEFLREGARARSITGLITELTEKFITRVAEMVERKLGAASLPYTVFLYGDGGRRELTLNLRPKLGIVYDEGDNMVIAERARKYFEEFARVFNGMLEECGFTASSESLNPAMIRGLKDWKALVKELGDEPFEHSVDEGLFDLRAIKGDEDPARELRKYLHDVARESEGLMDMLATRTVSNRPPIGFFNRFVVEKSGEHRNELDIFEKGIRPIIDAIRIFSIEKNIDEVSTLNRLDVLKQRYGFERAGDTAEALEYVFTLVIHDQIGQIDDGAEVDSFLNPELLTNLERKTLKETFILITNLYDVLEKGYRTERVGG